MEERHAAAILQACRALRRRHGDEELAHGPACQALRGEQLYCGSLYRQSKVVEDLEEELRQLHQAGERWAQQLRDEETAVQELRRLNARTVLRVAQLKDARSQSVRSMEELEVEKAMAERRIDSLKLEIALLRDQVAQVEQAVAEQVAENERLAGRMVEESARFMQVLRESDARYSTACKAKELEEYAREHVAGSVRGKGSGGLESEESEEWQVLEADEVRSYVPERARRLVKAHEGGCSSLVFARGSGVLLSGGHDRGIRVWDPNRSVATGSLKGFLGSILDIAISGDDQLVLAASSEDTLFLWEANSGRLLHTLTGHTARVSAADFVESTSLKAVSAADDRTIKVWDLAKGYGLESWACGSHCTSLAATTDGFCVCSGHLDGSLRVWDIRTRRTGPLATAGPHSVTSVTVSKTGRYVLTAGRDNSLRVFDLRHLETQGAYTASGFGVATNWTRSCMSADENYIACGSVDGSVFVWVINTKESYRLKAHNHPVHVCAWSNRGGGGPLVSGDRQGFLCIWD